MKTIDYLFDFINGRSKRERALLLFTGMVLIYLLVEILLLNPLRTENQLLTQNRNTQLEKYQEKIAQMKRQPNGDNTKKKLSTALPKDVMPKLLAYLDGDLKGLSLEKIEVSDNHEFKLTLMGEFQQLVNYAKYLDAGGFNLRCKSLSVQMIQRPLANIQMSFVISNHKDTGKTHE